MAQNYTLTPEQEALIDVYKKKWLKVITEYTPYTDEVKTEVTQAINALYKSVGEAPPKEIYFVKSIISLRLVGGLAVLLKKKNIRFSLADLIEKVESSTRQDDLTQSFINPLITALDLSNLYGLGKEGKTSINSTYNEYVQGGNQWAGWCVFNNYFKEVLADLAKENNIDFTEYNNWETLALLSGPRFVHEDFVLFSEKPVETHLLELGSTSNQVLHNKLGPAQRYLDGTSIYRVYGIEVPAWVVEAGNGRIERQITPEDIDKEPNAEIRRIMIEYYGNEKYLLSGNYQVIDEDIDLSGNPRRLLQKQTKDDEALLMIEVVNSTPEPQELFDQLSQLSSMFVKNKEAYRKHYLPVDPELRPICPGLTGEALENALKESENLSREERIQGGYLGKAQKLTCHNGVASSFGKYGSEYGINGQKRQGDVLITMSTGDSLNESFQES